MNIIYAFWYIGKRIVSNQPTCAGFATFVLVKILKVLNLNWFYSVCQSKVKNPGIEVELAFHAAFDILGLAETMTLTWECQVSDRNLFCFERLKHEL